MVAERVRVPADQLDRGAQQGGAERVDAPRGADVDGEGDEPAHRPGVVALAADGPLGRGHRHGRHFPVTFGLDQQRRPVRPVGDPLAASDRSCCPSGGRNRPTRPLGPG